VLSPAKGRRWDKLLTGAFPEARVHQVVRQSPSAVHAVLAARGPFDIIVDHTGHPDQVKQFRRTFFHLKPGGVLLMRVPPRRVSTGTNIDDGSADAISAYLARFTAEAPSAAEASGQEDPEERVLAAATGRVRRRAQHLLVENKLSFLAKMREHEMNRVIELRPAAGPQVLERRAGGAFRSRCQLRENAGHHNQRMTPEFAVPEISLRAYDGVLCVPGQVAVQGNLVLPDSYRHNQQKRLKNRFTEEVAPRFARLSPGASDPTPLPGTYFYLDNELRGHFGHTLTEQMSKLWAWPLVKKAYPDVQGLVSYRPSRGRVSDAELAIFDAAGISSDRIVVMDGPVLVEKLVSATPMFSMPAYVHPDIRDVWATVGDALVASAPERSYPRRIFCARRMTKRACRNADAVESLFEQHGFEVVYPEDYTLSEQVRMFREATVVAGFAGSGLFHLAFCEAPKQVVMISSESYTATNEYMISSVIGHKVDIVWCPSDLPQPDAGFSKQAFESDFTFDFDRDGDHLMKILGSLEDASR